MKIHRVVNNNFAVIIDENQQEKVVMGKGISFGKKAGAMLNPNDIEKEYVLMDKEVMERFTDVVRDINPICLDIAEYIINKSKEVLGKDLNENIYVSLTDHIQYTVNRYHQGLQLKNDMFWHIKRVYPKEYELGKEAVSIINKEFDIDLLDDESSFIALHIVAAQTGGEVADAMNMTKIIKDIINIVCSHTNKDIDEDSIHYARFITHLRFFAGRMAKKEFYDDETSHDDPVFEAVRTSYPSEYACANKIGIYVNKIHGHKITNDELLYLTIHIKRMVMEE